jgi:hypothetical protein
MASKMSAVREAMEKLKNGGKVSKLDQLKAYADGVYDRLWCLKTRLSSGTFCYLDPSGDSFIPFTELQLIDHLMTQGYGKLIEEASYEIEIPRLNASGNPTTARQADNYRKKQIKLLSQSGLKNVFARVRQHKLLDWVGRLAGYRRGEYSINDYKILIEQDLKLLMGEKTADSEEPFFIRLVKAGLPTMTEYDVTEAEFALAWLKDRRRALMDDMDQYWPGQALIIGGDVGVGKTLFRTLGLQPLLGGCYASALDYLTGDEKWNDDLARAYVWFVDDQGFSLRFNRLTYAKRLKTTVAVPELHIKTKFQSSITVPLRLALVILFNTEGPNYSLLPENDPDIRGKLLVLKWQEIKWLGQMTNTEIYQAMTSSLPAAAAWLDSYEVPTAIRTTQRFRIQPYQNPEIREEIQMTSSQEYLRQILQDQIKGSKEPWITTSTACHRELVKDVGIRTQLEEICRGYNQFAPLLRDLSRIKESGVTFKRTGKARLYQIEWLREDQYDAPDLSAGNVIKMTADLTETKQPASQQPETQAQNPGPS